MKDGNYLQTKFGISRYQASALIRYWNKDLPLHAICHNTRVSKAKAMAFLQQCDGYPGRINSAPPGTPPPEPPKVQRGEPSLPRVRFLESPQDFTFADYSAGRNSALSYEAGLRAIRLERIRAGHIQPRPNDAEEIKEAAAGAAERGCRPVVKHPQAHRISA